MSLKILVVDEEPELEVSFVPMASSEENESEPELPEEFFKQDDLDQLEETLAALESIHTRIACEGMNTTTARELEKIDISFIRRCGGMNVFTSYPSLEGLSEAAATVKERLTAVVQRLRSFVSEMYKRFVAWLTAKFARPENQDIKQDLEAFFAERRNLEALKFLSEMPEDIEEVASKIAILMDGDTKAFASTFIDQIQGTMKRAAGIEKMIGENPAHFYLATGELSVAELYQRDGATEILRKASDAADRAMMARNNTDFTRALTDVSQVSEELDKFEAEMIVKDKVDPNGQETNVSIIKLYENIRQASDDLKKVNVKQMVENMTATVRNIIKISDETKIDDILEMIPQDVSEQLQNDYAQKVALLYRKMAALGTKVLKLWKIRADSIQSLNSIGDALLGLVDGFEKAIVGSGTSLTVEQKSQLAKALAGKGLKIIF